MYELTVRDHFMIAHSFRGEIFGPAQKMHGATYVVDASFRRADLDEDDLIVDIGLASPVLSDILARYNFQNLDEIEAFRGRNTTTEFMAKVIFDDLAEAIQQGRLGPSANGLNGLKVSLKESHLAWASYEGAL
jgi:6-pyruvoyl-tetrahydropterin synthase